MAPLAIIGLCLTARAAQLAQAARLHSAAFLRQPPDTIA